MSRTIEVIARGLLRHGRFVLACRDVSRGYLSLPGGHVDAGETMRAACEREFLEETGLRVTATDCLAVADVAFVQGGVPVQEVTVVFHVEPGDRMSEVGDKPSAVASREPRIEFEWVAIGEIARRDFRPGCIKDWICNEIGETAQAAQPIRFLEQHREK